MSGRKRYDEDQALDSAMRLFWEKGYGATSVGDLEKATGLNKSSIYNAYGSKEALYLRCLERFGKEVGGPLAATLSDPDFRGALEAFFDLLLTRMGDEHQPNSCMATFAALETGGHGAPAETIREGLERVRGAFLGRCQRAARDGQLRDGANPYDAAAACLAMTRGIAVLNRGYGDIDVARQAARHLIDSLVAKPPENAGLFRPSQPRPQ